MYIQRPQPKDLVGIAQPLSYTRPDASLSLSIGWSEV